MPQKEVKIAALTHIYPSKKRGIIWLISSLLLFGVAGWAAFIYGISVAVKFGALIFSFYMFTAPKFAADLYWFYLALAACTLAYTGVCYGVMLIISAYQKYPFKKARILALALSSSSIGIVLLILNLS
jgi:Kef-type K+ transport system membrane component KefB